MSGKDGAATTAVAPTSSALPNIDRLSPFTPTILLPWWCCRDQHMYVSVNRNIFDKLLDPSRASNSIW